MTREEAAAATDFIRPGYYSTKLVKGGPEVPCRIVEVGGLWVLMICGAPTTEAAVENPFTDRQMTWVARGREIDADTYDAMLTAAAEAKPGEPLADPLSPVDWRSSPSVY